MNILAGIVIGLIASSWLVAAEYSLVWALVHVAYGFIFGFHQNPVVDSTHAGNPVLSYFMARFVVGLITSFVFALITFFIAKAIQG